MRFLLSGARLPKVSMVASTQTSMQTLGRAPVQPLVRATARIAVLSAVLVSVACSPTFNWRNVPLPGASLQAQMPCKPERAERQVPLTESGTTLRLLSCEAGGLTFALAWAAVPADQGQALALDNWQQAGWASLRLPPGAPAGASAAAPAGWTAWASHLPRAQHLRGWQGEGLDHLGKPVSARQLYFSHEGTVYQAAVYGSRIEAATIAPFFEALRLPAQP